MGGIEVFPSYQHVRAFMKRYGMEAEFSPPYQLINPDNGARAPISHIHNGLPLTARVVFFADIARYFLIRRRYARFVDDPEGVQPDPEGDLAMPFEAFLRHHGLQSLARLFHVPVTNYGYGFLDEIPAAYALKYMRPGMLDAFIAYGLGRRQAIGWLPRVGYQGLMSALAADLGDCVRTGVRDIAVTRDERILVRIGDHPPETYDLLIVASPDAATCLDLTEEEAGVLRRVTHRNYATVLLEADGIPPGGYGFNLGEGGAVVAPRDRGPLQMLRPWEDRPHVICYAYARDAAVGLEDLVERCRETVERIGGQVREVLDARAWSYFPHLDCAALREGQSDRLRALQRSHPRTRWAGSLFSFEIVEDAMAQAAHLVDTVLAEEAPAARSN